MWLDTAPLVPVEVLRLSKRQLRRQAEWSDLAQREQEVRAFALGETKLDLNDFANPNARFIDAYAVVHPLKSNFAPRNILGFDNAHFELDSLEFIGLASTVISIAALVRRNPSNRTESLRIVWTIMWSREGGSWEILNSQASRT